MNKPELRNSQKHKNAKKYLSCQKGTFTEYSDIN